MAGFSLVKVSAYSRRTGGVGAHVRGRVDLGRPLSQIRLADSQRVRTPGPPRPKGGLGDYVRTKPVRIPSHRVGRDLPPLTAEQKRERLGRMAKKRVDTIPKGPSPTLPKAEQARRYNEFMKKHPEKLAEIKRINARQKRGIYPKETPGRRNAAGERVKRDGSPLPHTIGKDLPPVSARRKLERRMKKSVKTTGSQPTRSPEENTSRYNEFMKKHPEKLAEIKRINARQKRERRR